MTPKRKKNVFYRTPKGSKPSRLQRPKDTSTLLSGLERLERYIAHQGLASRREAKKLIETKQVLVNGTMITEPGYGIDPVKDKVSITANTSEKKEAILLYKARGIETSKTSPSNTDIHDKFPTLAHLAPIGRLDTDTQGLIILTSDGTLTRALTKTHSTVEKEYLVEVRELVTPDALSRLEKGIILDKVMTKPTTTKKVSRSSFTIVLREGRHHQIRRMCDACHLTIESLTRIRIGHLNIGSMKPGFVKRISEKDVEMLKK